ncbi:MAG: hypothetical protein PHI12_08350 [Dehalococcoidales bacterium]|nr:hypothetical protein [Dehalococcoidales bacterium]
MMTRKEYERRINAELTNLYWAGRNLKWGKHQGTLYRQNEPEQFERDYQQYNKGKANIVYLELVNGN